MARAKKDGWQRKLAYPVVLRDDTNLKTLHDARAFIVALPGPRV
jgi:hypothetical protein